MGLHPDIARVTEQNMQSGDFDGAILNAAEFLQSKLREVSGLMSNNTTLIDDIFTQQKVLISIEPDKNVGAKNLFDGFFRLIRNDRGHWKSTRKHVEIACKDADQCMWYLGFASLLLYYVENHNLVHTPEISEYRPIIGSTNFLELRGRNLGKSTIEINGTNARIQQQSLEFVLIEVPSGVQNGTIKACVGDMTSTEIPFLLGDLTHKNTYEVIESDLPLFSNAECTQLRTEVKGVKLHVHEKGRTIVRVSPTTKSFNVGDYVGSEEIKDWDMRNSGVGETWYIDSVTGEKKYAWTGSAIFNGKAVGHADGLKPVQIIIRPAKIVLGAGERRGLQAQLVSKDSVRTQAKLITHELTWKSEDENIAFVDKKGVLLGKRNGRTRLHCSHNKLFSIAHVEVCNVIPRQPIDFFGGLTHLQEIKFASDGTLFICNQSPCIGAITPEGIYQDSVIRLASIGDNEQRVDRLYVDASDNIFLRAYGQDYIYKFNKSDSYKKAEIIKREGSWASITMDSKGNLFLGSHNSGFTKIAANGTETFVPTDGNPIVLRVIDDNALIMGRAGGGDALSVYSVDGELLRSFTVNGLTSPTDIAVRNGEVYVAGFHSQNVVKVDLQGDRHEQIVKLPAIPGGLDFDREGNLYISMFDKEDSIYKVYM